MHDMFADEAHDADIAACRETIKGGSKTFFAASLLLPGRVRAPAYALYAFCRLSDDAVDVDGGRMATIARLRDRLARAYAGRPLPQPVDRALARTVERFDIPAELPLALIEGLAWDAAGRRYASLAELETYAARVAGSVGAMMALLMEVRDEELVARACDLGVAMQFTNIARDVGEDARNGRIYLPLDWLAEAGIEPDRWLSAPAPTDALRGVVARLLAEADRLYERADSGIARLPLSCRPGIGAARLLYAEIGREIERGGFDSVSRRAVVPHARKVALLPRAVTRPLRPMKSGGEAPLPGTRYLVEAVRPRPSSAPRLAWWDIAGRYAAVIDIFCRLERRDRLAELRHPQGTARRIGCLRPMALSTPADT